MAVFVFSLAHRAASQLQNHCSLIRTICACPGRYRMHLGARLSSISTCSSFFEETLYANKSPWPFIELAEGIGVCNVECWGWLRWPPQIRSCIRWIEQFHQNLSEFWSSRSVRICRKFDQAVPSEVVGTLTKPFHQKLSEFKSSHSVRNYRNFDQAVPSEFGGILVTPFRESFLEFWSSHSVRIYRNFGQAVPLQFL